MIHFSGRRFGAWLAVVAFAGLTAGCPPVEEPEEPVRPPDEVQEVRIMADEFQFNPSQITARAGETLDIMLENQGETEHSIAFDMPMVFDEPRLEPTLAPGDTGTLRMTAPDEPGQYEFYCPVGNHREMGMTGTLIVTDERPAQPPPGEPGGYGTGG